MVLLLRSCRINHRTLSLALLGILTGAWGTTTLGNDFEYLRKQIDDQSSVVAELESRGDRASHQLLEPLLSLARAQILANRFDDADASLDHALQVVRIRDGLFAPSQYSIMEQAIENNIQRGAWDAASAELEHLQWLYAEQFQGDAEEQVGRLMWLRERYLLGVFNDREDRQVQHLKDATRLNTMAYKLAVRNHASLETRKEVAWSLLRLYHLEVQGIRRGDEIGFQIRSYVPESGKVEERKVAVNRRFSNGQRLLRRIRNELEQTQPGNAEALALLDINIADWRLLFNKSDAIDEYPSIYRRMIDAGMDRDKLDALFAQPVALPRPELYLDLDTALASQDRIETGPLTLVERSANFPGVVATALPDPSEGPIRAGAFVSTDAEVTLDPFSPNKGWVAGTYRTNWGTAAVNELVSASGESAIVHQARRNLLEVHLRPVLSAGEPQSTHVKLRYLVRRNEPVRQVRDLENLLLSQL